jgi:hypothetical protein
VRPDESDQPHRVRRALLHDAASMCGAAGALSQSAPRRCQLSQLQLTTHSSLAHGQSSIFALRNFFPHFARDLAK